MRQPLHEIILIFSKFSVRQPADEDDAATERALRFGVSRFRFCLVVFFSLVAFLWHWHAKPNLKFGVTVSWPKPEQREEACIDVVVGLLLIIHWQG